MPTQPPWRVIYEDIRRQIETGELRPGEQLPSTPNLRDEYQHLSPVGNLSLAPVRRALQTLEVQGWLTMWPGLGFYVAQEPPIG